MIAMPRDARRPALVTLPVLSTVADRRPEMQTPVASIVMFVVAAALGAVGQLLYKNGADAAGRGLVSYVLNVRILGGAVCYVAVMVLFVAAFRRGGSLTVLYPVYASTFIWAAILAMLVYSEPIKLMNVLGMALLVTGMYCMGR